MSQLLDLATPFFGAGPGPDPHAWRAGNPLTRVGDAGEGPPLRVLLAHASSDTTIRVAFTEQLAAELRATGHPVEVGGSPGADHHGIDSPALIAPRILARPRALADQ